MGYAFLTTATVQVVIKTFNPPAEEPDGGYEKAIKVIENLREQLKPIDQTHENIAAFCLDVDCLRLVGQSGPAIAMPWFKNGNIINYLEQHHDANPMSLIKGAASGLAYLHSIKIAHGNVHTNNILITDDGQACIADIKVNTIVLQAMYPTSDQNPFISAYRAPEELSKGARDVFTDVYAFASTIYIVYKGRARIGTGREAFLKAMQHITEQGCDGIFEKPPRMSQGLWELLHECWCFHPFQRPVMADVEAQLAILDRFCLV